MQRLQSIYRRFDGNDKQQHNGGNLSSDLKFVKTAELPLAFWGGRTSPKLGMGWGEGPLFSGKMLAPRL